MGLGYVRLLFSPYHRKTLHVSIVEDSIAISEAPKRAVDHEGQSHCSLQTLLIG